LLYQDQGSRYALFGLIKSSIILTRKAIVAFILQCSATIHAHPEAGIKCTKLTILNNLSYDGVDGIQLPLHLIANQSHGATSNSHYFSFSNSLHRV
jgi:hypothetical protein